MDQFDFSEPVYATIICDDSDDEIQPSIDDLKKGKKETIIDSSKVIQVQEETANDLSKVIKVQEETVNNRSTVIKVHEVINKQIDSIFPPVNNTLNTETCVSVQFDIEGALHKLAKSITSDKVKECALQQKPLDMPSLEENNNNVKNVYSPSNESDKNEETKTKNNANSVKQKNKFRPSNINKFVSKRKLNEELCNSDKTLTTIKISDENKNICKSSLTTDKNNAIEVHEKASDELHSTDDSNGTQKQDACDVETYSKYFVHTPSRKEISPIESMKQKYETEKPLNVSVETTPIIKPINQEQSNGDKSFQSLTAGNYVKVLLDTVSEHMIYILNSYQSYVNLFYNNPDLRLIENAKNNYIRTKNHFFDLSYSSVLIVILPRINDPTFVRNFLNSTIQIGNSKSSNYSYDQMEKLYHDMITWVQKRKEQIQTMNLNTISNTMLVQELQKPRSRPPVTQKNQQVKKQSAKKRSTKSKQTPEDISESPYLHQPDQHSQPYFTVKQFQNQIPHSKPPPPYPNQDEQYFESSPALNGFGFQSSRFAEQSHMIPPNFLQQDLPNQHFENPSLHIKQNILQKSNVNLQQMQVTNIQRYTTYQNHLERVTPHQNSVPSWLNSVNPTNNQAQKQAPHTWKPNYQEIISSQNSNQYLQPENTTQTEHNRSSISRDSGFMSPLNFNTSNDVSLQQESRPQPTGTPLITHVTSLNPNVSLIKDGNCAICGKITKQKCLGCFNCYYCGHDCQFLDWKTHQYVCK